MAEVPPVPQIETPVHPSPLAPLRVLLVEDNQVNQKLIKGALEMNLCEVASELLFRIAPLLNPPSGRSRFKR